MRPESDRAPPWTKGESDFGVSVHKVTLSQREPAPWQKDQSQPAPAPRDTDRAAPWTKSADMPERTAPPSKPTAAPWDRQGGNAATPMKGARVIQSYRAPWTKGDSNEHQRRDHKMLTPWQTDASNHTFPQKIVSEGGVALGSVTPSRTRPRTAMERMLDPTLDKKLELQRRGKKNVNYIYKNARNAVKSPTRGQENELETEAPSPYLQGKLAEHERKVPKKYRDVKSKFRQEVPLHQQKAQEEKGKKAGTCLPGSGRAGSATPTLSRPGSSRKTATGAVPTYLQQRKAEWKREAEAKAELERNSDGAPPGHTLMPDDERRRVLAGLGKELQDALDALQGMAITSDTLRSRQKRADLENKVADLEDGIRFFSRKKVFVKARN